ncbi:hypothetical protein G5I_14557 [Acromyrmex echinatior]|uniref:Uncharacterized protein n=1 Tax=Acromyrmex echinatior TaxID=103372 RepID=F4X821_ACREC|nr:hypothetical protein G5I_14557 [Acromyrmex echinatior]
MTLVREVTCPLNAKGLATPKGWRRRYGMFFWAASINSQGSFTIKTTACRRNNHGPVGYLPKRIFLPFALVTNEPKQEGEHAIE